jgi:hypothetical protein
MTMPLDHYREAEALLADLEQIEQDQEGAMSDLAAAYFARTVAVAQVHATLAAVPVSPPITSGRSL